MRSVGAGRRCPPDRIALVRAEPRVYPRDIMVGPARAVIESPTFSAGSVAVGSAHHPPVRNSLRCWEPWPRTPGRRMNGTRTTGRQPEHRGKIMLKIGRERLSALPLSLISCGPVPRLAARPGCRISGDAPSRRARPQENPSPLAAAPSQPARARPGCQ